MASIKNALEAAAAPYNSRNFTVFQQGSYGNDTNIYAESDVDVVIRYNGAFFSDLSALPPDQLAAHKNSFSDGTYPYNDFKTHVQAALKSAFGTSVKPSKKAIKVDASNARRSADVVVAFEFRRYFKFNSAFDENHVTGICFFDSGGSRISNYPDQHCKNCTTKHQLTGNRFKPMVRTFKNMRTKLVEDGVIADGIAPSYYIEGLLYNVPNENFVADRAQTVVNILNWLAATTDRTKFVCANEQYYLLRNNSPVCWPEANGSQFINAVIQLWNNW